jgi:hypothetical protein
LFRCSILPSDLREIASVVARTSEPGPCSWEKKASATLCFLLRSFSMTIPRSHPKAPETLFDGTEIDEILSLRIMTLTDEEKREMSQSDERARQMLERTKHCRWSN